LCVLKEIETITDIVEVYIFILRYS